MEDKKMKNLVFVIWMIGFPLAEAVADAIKYRVGIPIPEYDKTVIGLSAVVSISIWFYVGWILFEGQ